MRRFIIIMLGIFSFGCILEGGNQAQQTITISVQATNELVSDLEVEAISGTLDLSISLPTFKIGSDPTSKRKQTITMYYSIDTNEENKKLTAMLDRPMPEGVTLSSYVTPPQGSRTTGEQELSTFPSDMVIEISFTAGKGLPIFYTMTAERSAGVVPTQTRVITYSLVDG